MASRYKKVCILKEDGTYCTIYRDVVNNTFYKMVDGKTEKISLDDKCFYQWISKVNDKITLDKEIKVQKARMKKISYNAIYAILLATMIGIGARAYYVNNEPKREYIHSEKKEDDVMQLFTKSMEKNHTINQYCANDINKYLQEFVNECNNLGVNNDDNYIKIARQLRLIDLSDQDAISMGNLLEIFDFNNGKFIATELYSYFNDITLNHRYTTIANFFYFNEDAKAKMLTGEKVKINIDDKVFSLNLKDLDKNDEEMYAAIDEYTNDGLDISDPDFCWCRANIFSPLMEMYLYDSEVILYYENYEDKGVRNVSYREYYKKLANLIYTEGEKIDYNNKNDRALIYLYAEALRRNYGYQDKEEPAEYILKTILSKDSYLPSIIDKVELLRYLNGEEFDVKHFVDFWDICLTGEDSIGIIQELNRCLKAEVYSGNLTQEDYNYFIEMVVIAIEECYPERLEEFKEANLYDRSIEGFKLKLIPYLEL